MEKFTKKEFFALIGLVLLGGILRIYGLDVYPAGFHGDEAWTGIEAKRILEQGYIGFWSSSALGQTTLPYYWTAIIFYFFGDNIFTARLSFVLLNILSIPFFYLVVKIIFSRKIAVISTFLFITNYTSLSLQRRSDYVAVNFAFFPSILFTLLALKTNKIVYFIFAGIFIGLSHHMYATYWIIPFIFLVYILYRFLILRKEFIRKYSNNLTILLISYLLVASPMIIFAVTNPNEFSNRSNAVSIFSQQGINHARSYLPNKPDTIGIWLNNIKAYSLMFNLKGDVDIRNNLSTLPVFDVITGIVFLIGLSYCLYRYKQPSIILIYLLFLIFFISSTFTTDAPNFRRSQVIIYIAYIFAGVGIVWIYNFLLRIYPKYKFQINLILISVLICSVYYNQHLYFRQAKSTDTKNTFSYPLVKTSEFLDTLSQPLYVYFYSSSWSYNYETLKFLAHNISGEDRSSQFGVYSLTNNNTDKTVVYLFLPDYQSSFLEVQKIYPDGRMIIKKDIDNTILFYSYIIPKKI